jgi:SAM-dependent methyltransferase
MRIKSVPRGRERQDVHDEQRSKAAMRIVETLRRVVPKGARHLMPASIRRAGWRLLRGETDAPQTEQWLRLIMNRDINAVINALPPQKFDAVEISGELRESYSWRSYTRTRYPEFDLCAPLRSEDTYSLVICEQVLEHTADPWRAARNLRQMCRPDGFVLVSTPFLVRLHDSPLDYWRFTPDGLQLLLNCAGLDVLWVRSWGNRRCVRGNFRVWARYRAWHSLRNEERFPLVVWALAKPAQ